MTSDFLFSEFPYVSSKEWKQKIQADLKGADYDKTLLTDSIEGITIKPFYHNDAYKQIEVPNNNSEFKICQSIFISDEKTANSSAIDALKRGADVILFIAKDIFQYDILLNNIFSPVYKDVEINFQLEFLNQYFIEDLIYFVESENVYLNIDIIGNFIKTGNWFYNKIEDHKLLKSILKKSKNNVGLMAVNVSHYQNSGANIAQQIAYALSHANEYLNFLFEMNEKEVFQLSQLEEIVKNIQFNFAIGGNYFFEIAKLRAFRVLWKLLLQEYNLNEDANIFAIPSLRNKSIFDYNVNMLRTTTECMSAILGGANTISNVSYDVFFHNNNEFGERIARNQLIILKEESNLKNADFAEGSYYIEELTTEFCDKALIIFKEIENNGGFIKNLSDGIIQKDIIKSAQKEQDQFDTGDLVLLGVNKHPNNEDLLKSVIELYPFAKSNKTESEIEPIINKRIAESAEQERLLKEAFF